MKILITGGNGYVAKSLFKFLNNIYDITIVTRNDFDLSNSIETCNFFKDKFFDVVINCAVVGGSRLKKDDWSILDSNLIMYYNLIQNKNHFNKLINFGSGAEIFADNTPYGYSKSVIRKSIKNNHNFFNIRIFAVFNEDELNTRFIKSSILNHINGEIINVFGNKKMDFFYMGDLISVVRYYIENDNPPKEFDCTYEETKTILHVAQFISQLGNVKSQIVIGGNDNDYCGKYQPLYIDYTGLEQGIINTYDVLKSQY